MIFDLTAHSSERFSYTRVQSIAQPNLIILPLLKRAVFLYPKSKKAR
uniref:Uncharacterized protein n=1 Tax=Siphoviridae sp. ctF2K4 TaxID=2825401 RepID=A0A8S5VF12_9CAUD|nr:MAG TPA: hypothetical protein [Siphoviridae sp. ctF2K4]